MNAPMSDLDPVANVLRRPGLFIVVFVLVAAAGFSALARMQPMSSVHIQFDIGHARIRGSGEAVAFEPPDMLLARVRDLVLDDPRVSEMIRGYSYSVNRMPPSLRVEMATGRPEELSTAANNAIAPLLERHARRHEGLEASYKKKSELLSREFELLTGSVSRAALAPTASPPQFLVQTALQSRMIENENQRAELEWATDAINFRPTKATITEGKKSFSKTRRAASYAGVLILATLSGLLAAVVRNRVSTPDRA